MNMFIFFFFSSRRRHTRYWRDWSSDVCSSDLDLRRGDPVDDHHQHGAGMSDAIDLGLGLVDHQLIDSEGRRCGKVDDLELTGIQEGRLQVAEILVGRRGAVHVPWEEVAKVDSGV